MPPPPDPTASRNPSQAPASSQPGAATGKPSPSSGAARPPLEVLPRVLGPFDAVAIVVGSIIGSGIFLKVSNIDDKVPAFGAILAVWLLGGLATLCGSLSLAELAAMLPHAGGPYVYLREAYGRITAFLWGWAEFSIIRTGSLGSLACGTVIYFNKFLESLEANGVLPESEIIPLPHFAQALVTLAAVLVLTFVNVIGTRWAARTQNFTTVIKLTFLMVLMLGPLAFGKWTTANFQPIAPDSFTPDFFKAFGLAMVAVFWPYDGWINIGPVAEEIRKPQRNVPLGLGLGVLVVTFVYVGANIGYHMCLPLSETRVSKTIAADVFETILGRWGVPLAAAGVMISMFGALNSNLLAGPRIYFAMARDGLFPRAIGRVHTRFQTPANAVLAQALWSLLQIVVAFWVTADPKGAFDVLTDFVVLGGTIFYALVVAAVLVLRYKLPAVERPYKTLFYPLTPILYLLTALLVVGSMTSSFLSAFAPGAESQFTAEALLVERLKVPGFLGLMAVGLALYALFRRLEQRAVAARS